MSECKGIFGKYFGHNFQAIYHYGKPTVTPERYKGNSDSLVEIMNASKEETYVHSICKRCGQIIKEEKSNG